MLAQTAKLSRPSLPSNRNRKRFGTLPVKAGHLSIPESHQVSPIKHWTRFEFAVTLVFTSLIRIANIHQFRRRIRSAEGDY